MRLGHSQDVHASTAAWWSCCQTGRTAALLIVCIPQRGAPSRIESVQSNCRLLGTACPKCPRVRTDPELKLSRSSTWFVWVPRHTLRAVVTVPSGVALAEANAALAMPATLVDAHRFMHLYHACSTLLPLWLSCCLRYAQGRPPDLVARPCHGMKVLPGVSFGM